MSIAPHTASMMASRSSSSRNRMVTFKWRFLDTGDEFSAMLSLLLRPIRYEEFEQSQETGNHQGSHGCHAVPNPVIADHPALKHPANPQDQTHNLDRRVEGHQHVAHEIGDREQHDHVLVGTVVLLRDHLCQTQQSRAQQCSHRSQDVAFQFLAFGELVNPAGKNQSRPNREHHVAHPIGKVQQAWLKRAHRSLSNAFVFRAVRLCRLPHQPGSDNARDLPGCGYHALDQAKRYPDTESHNQEAHQKRPGYFVSDNTPLTSRLLHLYNASSNDTQRTIRVRISVR